MIFTDVTPVMMLHTLIAIQFNQSLARSAHSNHATQQEGKNICCDFSCSGTFVSVFCGCHRYCSVASAALRFQTSAVSTLRQGCVAVSAPTRRMRTSQIYSHAQKAPTLEVCVNPAALPSHLLIRRNLIAGASFVHHQGFKHSTGFSFADPL